MIERGSLFSCSITTNGTNTAYSDALTLGSFVSGGLANIEIDGTSLGTTTAHFAIQVKDHSSGEFYDFLSDSDFDSSSNANIFAVSDLGPQELTVGSIAHVVARLGAPYAIRFSTSLSDTQSGSLTIRGRLA